MALAMGQPNAAVPTVVDECVGQLFSMATCPHRAELQEAMAAVAASGSGLIIYLRSGSTQATCASPTFDDAAAMVTRDALIRQIHADQVGVAH